MDRIQGPGASPEQTFVGGNAFLGQPGTVVTPEFLNDLQEELIKGLIEYAGLVPALGQQNQIRQAVQLVTGSSGGQTGAIAQQGLVYPVHSFQREWPSPIVLASSALQRNPNPGIEAGSTSGPPSATNTLEANGYAGGTDNQQDGHLWPYQSFGGQMQGDSSVASGFFPGCWALEGINHYAWPDFVTPSGMIGMGGGRIRCQLDGTVSIQAVENVDYQIEIIIGRQLQTAWNSGNGGEVGSSGGFNANRAISILSPKLNSSTSYGSGLKDLRVIIDFVPLFKRVIRGTVQFIIGVTNADADAVVNATRFFTYTGPGTLNFNAHTPMQRWKILFKIDAATGGFLSKTVNNTPFGGAGSSPPRAAQDGNKVRLRFDHFRVDYIPGV